MIIAVEGADRAGKMTQSRMLAGALRRRGHGARVAHFPDYATPVGREIARWLRSRRERDPRLVHCLLAANRLERIQMLRGHSGVLVLDRYYHSNVAYGMANGLGRRWLEALDSQLPRADLVILLDIDPAESMRRRGGRRDRFESDARFLGRVCRAYRRLARDGRWRVIDASRDPADVHADVLAAALRRL
ncbi:MAG: AAA family ATPase [Nitrosopumilus sp.]|nr:AAA family ATPase [Nitrosopumilus sp.]CAI9831081.1 putative thymidylate kinase [Nitrosopumilaceae archaeon]MDA7941174.1 AAA family ATPase [Nitrosopumilus sp.]MDA7942428.1 AAA family ATPase [Nitrosopumilus sp.]MDA7944851.1 AAA family ATPase [Nitrosopumilus sp.]